MCLNNLSCSSSRHFTVVTVSVCVCVCVREMVNGPHLYNTFQHLHGTPNRFTSASHSLQFSAKMHQLSVERVIHHATVSLFHKYLRDQEVIVRLQPTSSCLSITTRIVQKIKHHSARHHSHTKPVHHPTTLNYPEAAGAEAFRA